MSEVSEYGHVAHKHTYFLHSPFISGTALNNGCAVGSYNLSTLIEALVGMGTIDSYTTAPYAVDQ